MLFLRLRNHTVFLVMHNPRILVAILVYNTESKAVKLSDAIKRFLKDQENANSYALNLVVFDDASRDQSALILQQNLQGVCEIVRAERNRGYGGSVKNVFEYARTNGHDYLCIFPGDMQRQFSDIPRLIDAALTGGYDLVAGVKDPSLIQGAMPLRRKYGNILIKNLTRLWGEKVSDPLAGFKLYKVFPCYKLIWLCQSRFCFDLDLSFWSTYVGLNKGEVPCSASYEDHSSTIRSTTLQGLRFVFRSIMLGFLLKPALHCLQYSTVREK